MCAMQSVPFARPEETTNPHSQIVLTIFLMLEKSSCSGSLVPTTATILFLKIFLFPFTDNIIGAEEICFNFSG